MVFDHLLTLSWYFTMSVDNIYKEKNKNKSFKTKDKSTFH
jgi:hypothetical protein